MSATISATLGVRLLVLVVLLVLGIETFALSLAARRSIRVPRMRTLLPNLAAGAFLALALAGSTVEEPFAVVAFFLLLAGIAHAWDLLARIRDTRRRP